MYISGQLYPRWFYHRRGGSICALNRRLGGSQSRSGGGWGAEKIFFYLSGMTTWPVGNSAHSAVTVPNEKCQVSHIFWTFQCVAFVQEQLTKGQWTLDREDNNLIWKHVFWRKTFLKRPWNVLPIGQDRQYINKIQQDATVCRYLFNSKSLYMFQVSIAPIIRST